VSSDEAVLVALIDQATSAALTVSSIAPARRIAVDVLSWDSSRKMLILVGRGELTETLPALTTLSLSLSTAGKPVRRSRCRSKSWCRCCLRCQCGNDALVNGAGVYGALGACSCV
jgi:hypothetical protein